MSCGGKCLSPVKAKYWVEMVKFSQMYITYYALKYCILPDTPFTSGGDFNNPTKYICSDSDRRK